jgi:hypothetical protein
MFGQNLQAGQFGNQALTQQNANQLANLGFNNQLGQQGFANQLAGTQANNAALQQNYAQNLAARNLPLQQLGAFQQGTQPGYVNPYSQAAVTGPDYLGATATSNAAAIAQQNANIAKQNATTQGLYGLGGAALLGSGGLGKLGSSGSSGSGLIGLGQSIYNLFGNNTQAANDLMSQVNMGLIAPDAGGSIFNSLPGMSTNLADMGIDWG